MASIRILKVTGKIFFLSLFITLGGCEPEVEPCLRTKWPLSKEYEIKLAVSLSESNPQLPDGAIGSQNPEDFKKMLVTGTIEKIECNEETGGPASLGNTYITREEDFGEPGEEPVIYWIGHVVYVYNFDNDLDHLNINLTVKITMLDGQSYQCKLSDEIFDDQINLVPGQFYYYILLDIYSDNWVKAY